MILSLLASYGRYAAFQLRCIVVLAIAVTTPSLYFLKIWYIYLFIIYLIRGVTIHMKHETRHLAVHGLQDNTYRETTNEIPNIISHVMT